ncbi:MAG: heme-binding protein [Christensenellaceae bacterium]|jgi:uncharacterized protein (UPF0303 family)|nr:heme-binding protein [Christensenellaceae bacterium]
MADDYREVIEIIRQQEEKLVFDAFSQDDSLKLGLKIIETVLDQYKKGVSVRIDLNGITVFSHLMGRAGLGNEWWMRKKMNACQKYGTSSFRAYLEIEYAGKLEEYPWAANQGNYALRGGCFPIQVKGEGTIGYAMVSGLPQANDHQLIADSIAALQGKAIPTVLGGMEFIP